MGLRIRAEECARAVCASRYRDARVVFHAGSIVRGEDTPHSDIDLVVVHDRLDHAYRESFVADGWPIEAFVHDRETLLYFFGTDRAQGIAVLAAMIDEGAELPASNDFSAAIKNSARSALTAGPVPGMTQTDRYRAISLPT